LKLPRIHACEVAKLATLGVQSIHDISEDYPLTARLRVACDSGQSGTPWFSPEIKGELAALKYPFYYMDFETVNPAIPRFAGMRPYDHIPFQWSVHVQREPGAEPEHYEFLATDRNDPRTEFITSLYAVLGDSGSIAVYNAQ